MESKSKCTGEHSFFVAETVAVEAEGKVFLLGLCTHCGEPFQKEYKIGEGHQQITRLE